MENNLTIAFKMLHRDRGQEVETDSPTAPEDIAESWKEAVIAVDNFKKRQPAILQGVENKEELEETILAQLDGLKEGEGELLLYDILGEDEEPEAQLPLYQLPQLALLLNKPPVWTEPEGEGKGNKSLITWVKECYKKRLEAVRAVDRYRERKKAIQSLLRGYEGEELRAIIYDTADRVRRAERETGTE